MVTVEVCPLSNESILSTIIDDISLQHETEKHALALRKQLPPCAVKQFDQLEDLLATVAAEIQRQTVKELHCPHCSRYHTCSCCR